jgi:two-component system sensor histidine kinase PilS (NtrC family)
VSVRPAPSASTDLSRRLSWLLAYRAGVGTVLLAVTLAADLLSWDLRHISSLLYGTAISTYVMVLMVGLMLRWRVPAGVLRGVHLTSVLLSAAVVVQATSGVESTFSFLYLLAILDAAILGSMPAAQATAVAGCVMYVAQLGIQWYDVLPSGAPRPALPVFANQGISHVAASFLCSWLAGHLAQLSSRARAEASLATRDLRRAEAIYHHVLEALPVGVMAVDAAGRVRLANATLSHILQESRERLLGAPPPAVLVAARDPVTRTSVSIAGATRHLEMARSTLMVEEGEGQQGAWELTVVDDRTRVQSLEESLRAREKLATIGQFSAAIAHELRNPLAAISGCVELFKASGASDAERDKLGTIVLREIARLNLLITDFLTYARPAPLARAPVDVAGLARDVCEVLRRDARWAGNEVTLRCPEALTVEADAAQLRQMLWNLLKNALEASPVQAAVEVYVEPVAAGVALTVKDRGEGIRPEIRAHLFEPFHTTKEGGTGLGLAVVHNIVTAHGGRIEVVSETHGGTQMRVSLPSVAQAQG